MIGFKKRSSKKRPKYEVFRHFSYCFMELWIKCRAYSIIWTLSLKLEFGKTNKIKAFWEILERREIVN